MDDETYKGILEMMDKYDGVHVEDCVLNLLMFDIYKEVHELRPYSERWFMAMSKLLGTYLSKLYKVELEESTMMSSVFLKKVEHHVKQMYRVLEKESEDMMEQLNCFMSIFASFDNFLQDDGSIEHLRELKNKIKEAFDEDEADGDDVDMDDVWDKLMGRK